MCQRLVQTMCLTFTAQTGQSSCWRAVFSMSSWCSHTNQKVQLQSSSAEKEWKSVISEEEQSKSRGWVCLCHLHGTFWLVIMVAELCWKLPAARYLLWWALLHCCNTSSCTYNFPPIDPWFRSILSELGVDNHSSTQHLIDLCFSLIIEDGLNLILRSS